jgi:hypothetical protein
VSSSMVLMNFQNSLAKFKVHAQARPQIRGINSTFIITPTQTLRSQPKRDQNESKLKERRRRWWWRYRRVLSSVSFVKIVNSHKNLVNINFTRGAVEKIYLSKYSSEHHTRCAPRFARESALCWKIKQKQRVESRSELNLCIFYTCAHTHTSISFSLSTGTSSRSSSSSYIDIL